MHISVTSNVLFLLYQEGSRPKQGVSLYFYTVAHGGESSTSNDGSHWKGIGADGHPNLRIRSHIADQWSKPSREEPLNPSGHRPVMITIVGTGHVFNLAEPVAFIVKNTWPDAILLELDVGRLSAISDAAKAEEGENIEEGPKQTKKPSALYAQTSRYQQSMSEEHGAQLGGEFIAAINAGKLVSADIHPIDTDAMRVMDEMWEEMSFKERFRYRLSAISDNIGGKKKVADVQKSFAENEDAYIEGMRRKYPTLVRKLIDERNQHMADQINEFSERYDNMVVIVGDAHVEGIVKLLDETNIRKIRLIDLMDPERMNKVRDMVWWGDVKQ